jgi:hypothetical protein
MNEQENKKEVFTLCNSCNGEILYKDEYLSNGDLRFHNNECLTKYYSKDFSNYVAGDKRELRWWEEYG